MPVAVEIKILAEIAVYLLLFDPSGINGLLGVFVFLSGFGTHLHTYPATYPGSPNHASDCKVGLPPYLAAWSTHSSKV